MVVQAGGPFYEVELGRFDGLRSKASDVNGRLPQPEFTLNQLNSLFAANGLTQTEMVALSGNARAPKKTLQIIELYIRVFTLQSHY